MKSAEPYKVCNVLQPGLGVVLQGTAAGHGQARNPRMACRACGHMAARLEGILAWAARRWSGCQGRAALWRLGALYAFWGCKQACMLGEPL